MKSKIKLKKLFYWLGGITVLFGIFIAFVLNRMKQQGEGEVLKKLEEAGINVSFSFIETEEGEVRIARSGKKGGDKLLMVHGSPGDWSAWSNMFLNQELQEQFDMIAFDRPGYGKTTVPAQETLAGQSAAAEAILKHYWQNDSIIVVGHSYGGAVVEQLAINQRQRIQHLIWVAGTLGPNFQAPKWYNKLGKLKLINWLLPENFKSSNTEMLSLQAELRENENDLSSLKMPITLIHGKEDILVPFATVDYLKSHLTGEVDYVLIDSMNHFVPWSNPDLIIDAILNEKH